MLFADDIVLVDETREGVNTKLELWRNNLESKGFKLSRKKTKYMECKFSKNARVEDVIIKLEDQILQKKRPFSIFGINDSKRWRNSQGYHA